jgi:hypothetical protein
MESHASRWKFRDGRRKTLTSDEADHPSAQRTPDSQGQSAIRRGSFSSVKELVGMIDHFVTPIQQKQQTIRKDRYGGLDSAEA